MSEKKQKVWNKATTYDKENDPRIAYSVLEKGLALPSVAYELGVTLQTVRNWMKNFTEFGDAIEKGQAAAEHALDSQAAAAITITHEPGGCKTVFNTELYKFIKKTRFRARETDDVQVVSVTSETDSDKLRELVSKLHSETI